MSTQIFTTIPQQIDILKSRGLKFRSENAAAQELQRHLVMIESSVTMHCLQYPDDADYILDSMGIRGLINVRRG